MTNDEKIAQLTDFARNFREFFGSVQLQTSDAHDVWLSLSPDEKAGWAKEIQNAYTAVHDWLLAAESRWLWTRELESSLIAELQAAITGCNDITAESERFQQVHDASISIQEMGDHWFKRCVQNLLLDSQ